MEIHTIKTEEDYKNVMNIVDSLIDSPVGSEEADKLEVLSILLEDYEHKHYKIGVPDPIAAIKQRAEQLGLTRKDLEKSIGSRSRVSEVLNHKRTLTLAMIRKLNKNLNIPADILIKDTRKKTA
jgi:HTH-type transcriptional regulator / antitoxin HigA